MRTTGVIMVIVIGVGPAVLLRTGLGVMVRTLASVLLVLVNKLAIMVRTLASALLVLVNKLVKTPGAGVIMDMVQVDHIPMRVKIMTRPITRTTLKIMIGRMETSTPRMKIALKILI